MDLERRANNQNIQSFVKLVKYISCFCPETSVLVSQKVVPKAYRFCPGIVKADVQSYMSTTSSSFFKSEGPMFQCDSARRTYRGHSYDKFTQLNSNVKYQEEGQNLLTKDPILIQQADNYETSISRNIPRSQGAIHLSQFSQTAKDRKLNFRRFSYISTADQSILAASQRNLNESIGVKLNIPYSQKQKMKNFGRLPYPHLKQKLMLFIYAYNLINCQSSNDLKYCYFYMPLPPMLASETLGSKLMDEMAPSIQEKMKLGKIRLYYFLKDGQVVRSAFDIPPREVTVLVSTTKAFTGVQSIGGLKLMIFINQLERVIPSYSQNPKYESIEQHIKGKYTAEIQDIADLMQGSKAPLGSSDLESLQKKPTLQVAKFLMLKRHKPKTQSSVIRSLYDSKDTYLASQRNIVEFGQQDVKDEIVATYEQELEDLKKEIMRQKEQGIDDLDVIETRNTQSLKKQVDEQQSSLKVESLGQILAVHNRKKRMIAQSNDIQVAFVGGGISKPEDLTKPKLTQRETLQLLEKFNSELYRQNVPKLMEATQFSRKEIHSAYIMFKALESVSSQSKNYEVGEGVDFNTFRNGIYQIFMQPEELAKEIFEIIDFNFSGYLNWQEFLDLMVIIKAKTLEERVNLFIRICDKDGNGHLSKEEIFNLTKVCLGRFITDHRDGFLEELCFYFTRLIFQSVGIDQSKEIPLSAIKEAILRGDSESELLTMFCGADL